MKTSTYGFLTLLVFIKNKDKPYCPSIKQLIDATDILANKLGCKDINISLATKYNIIKELEKQNLLISWKKGKQMRLKLSEKMISYLST
jgi:hypothetical protein